jgi:flagellar FliL protein
MRRLQPAMQPGSKRDRGKKMATAPRANPKVVPIDEVASPAVESKKSNKKMFLVLAGVLLLVFAAGIGWYFVANSPAKQNAEQEQEAPPVFLAMEPFTVNLQPEDIGEQYLQVVFTLQVEDQTQVDAIKLYMPLIRSRILMLLANKKASELNTEAGKKKLQEEIAAQVSEPYTARGKPQKVSGVFFTSFVIQ